MSAALNDCDIAGYLDRPIWTTLSTCHVQFSRAVGSARRFVGDIGPFAASRDNSPSSVDDLGQLLSGDAANGALLQIDEIAIPTTIEMNMAAEGVQMLLERAIAPPEQGDIVRLDAQDGPDMLALAELTKPGPFYPRTHFLGAFYGIRDKGRLVAMAGERFKQPGFTEVSAVCVHPDHRGRGYAGRLTQRVARRIQERGERVYLHAFSNNTNAIRLYERLGFRVRGTVNVAWLQQADSRRGQSASPPQKPDGD